MNDEELRLLELAIQAGEARISELHRASSAFTCVMCITEDSPMCGKCPIGNAEILDCGDYVMQVGEILHKLSRQVLYWRNLVREEKKRRR